MDEQQKKDLNDQRRRLFQGYAQITQFSGTIVVMVLVGVLIDQRFETKPWAMIGCATAGFLTAMVQLIRWLIPPGNKRP